jgi:phosphatidylglycerophosphate synthase
MARVQSNPWGWLAAGAAALYLLARATPISAAGWAAGGAYLLASAVLLARGLARRRPLRFGPANTATAARSTLIGLVTALVASSFTQPVPPWLLVALAAPALALDAVDGWLARRTGTASALGARFDMEVDSFALLALSVYVAPLLGWWVLAIGLMRYVFVAAGWVLPALNATLPPRYWRKVVTAACGIALALAAAQILPTAASASAVAGALALLVESFGRDVLWLLRTAHAARDAGGEDVSAAVPLRWRRSPAGRPARSSGGIARPSRPERRGTSRSST